MANKNFIVHNGLIVGSANIDASTGDANIGNLRLAGNQIKSSTGNVAITLTDKDITIAGNMTVSGTTTSINSTTLDVTDLNITVAKGAPSAAAANGAGLTVDGASATMLYINSSDTWVFNKGANITGNANVTGNIYAGNILTDNYKFANGVAFSVDATQILNGNSNVKVAANSNVTVSVAGNANVLTVTGTGANISGTANVTGNANVGNLGTASATLTGNLNFSGTGLRITGDFSNATISSRTMFQTSTLNSPTNVYAIPNGSSTTTSFSVSGNNDPGNAAIGQFIQTGTDTSIRSTLTGTGSYTPVTFYTGGSERARLDTNGNLGIANNAPTHTLSVTGTTNISGNANVGNLGTASATLTGNLNFSGTSNRITGDFSNATVSSRVLVQSSTTNGATFLSTIPNGTNTNSYILAYTTSDPTNSSTVGFAAIGGSDVRVLSGISGTGTYLPMTFYAGGSERARLDTNGNLGIANNAPTHTLSVTGTTNISGNANVGNLGTATAVITTANITTINNGLHQNGTSNITITNNGNVSTFIGGNATAQLVVTSSGANIAGTANIAGNVSTASKFIKTTSSGIAGGASGNITRYPTFTSTSNADIHLTSTTTGNATVSVNYGITFAQGSYGTTGAMLFSENTTDGTAIGFYVSNNYAAPPQVKLSIEPSGTLLPGANATQSFGSTTLRWANIWGLASSAQYADLAEYYLGDISYEPGTVLDFGGSNEVTICGTPMSTRIAGVVSTQPGFIMNDADLTDTSVPVALQGRVPTKVVGKIHKGDMMVSAGNGHAMACSSPVIGSVIGKALADFDGDEGVIEVVIGRN